ncbi:MAG TPA: preprotein translocase subunit YajC [Desulfosporosinus sp.]|nr:preprotein translocase subunit YajC [Desulfosporosinus sp.]
MTQQTTLILYIVIFIPFIYFVMIRPQQKQAKKRKTLMNGMKTRDVVITAGGLYGKITKVKEESILMTIADKVEVEVAKTGILSVENRDINLEKA